MINKTQSEKPTLLDLIGQDFEISRGHPLPLGATVMRGGINFSVFSKHASSVSLVLFVPGQAEPVVEFPLDPRYNRTGDIWHAFVLGLDHPVEYAYRAERDDNDQPNLHRFDRSGILLDPYGRAVVDGPNWGETDKIPARSLVVEDEFDWGEDRPLNIPIEDSIIYELHLRGFTRHPSSGVSHPGTFDGLIEKIPYLVSLGITAVELLPINDFVETETALTNPETGQSLVNFWGYNSRNFFAPKSTYSSDPTGSAPVHEFRRMVMALHEAGIEVILDVVFNHTAEGDERGHTHCFRGLDNSIYYLLDPETGSYLNFSGCGNSLNCNHPVVRDMILECLRYWVTEMHVDGFRFDLASVLGRGRDGSVLANPPLLERIAADPILGSTKLIAEAWDAAGLYQVGSFPSWGRWAEWNGKFRDDIRRFVKSDAGQIRHLANRLIGSPDLYGQSGHSINFVTCHDGFTLADLVSYSERHNMANGEDNRDGESHNDSWNCGFEGMTDELAGSSIPPADQLEIKDLRRRQVRNIATLLLISHGVPMILAGDEVGRTQRGNNNAYCQDNSISWFDWSLLETNSDLLRFFKLLIAFRKSTPLFRCDVVENSKSDGSPAFIWHGFELEKPDWSSDSRTLALQLWGSPSQPSEWTDIYVAANAKWTVTAFELPKPIIGQSWRLKIDTSKGNSCDIYDAGSEPVLPSASILNLPARSVTVLAAKSS